MAQRVPSGMPEKLDIIGRPHKSQLGSMQDQAELFELFSPGKGFIIYRAEKGKGDIQLKNVRVPWDVAADDVSQDNDVDIRVFAPEMVYIPEGLSMSETGCLKARFMPAAVLIGLS